MENNTQNQPNKDTSSNTNELLKPKLLDRFASGKDFVCFLSDHVPIPEKKDKQEQKNSLNDQQGIPDKIVQSSLSSEKKISLDNSNDKKQTHIYLFGSSLTNILTSDNSSDDLSIDSGFQKDEQFESQQQQQAQQLQQQNISINKDSQLQNNKALFDVIKETKFLKNLNYLNSKILSQYQPIQVTAFNNSLAILLKSEDDFTLELSNFKEFKKLFSDINSNLKIKKETFQHYFLNNITNENLTNIDDKILKLKTEDIDDKNAKTEDPDYKYRNCFIYSENVKDKLKELIGKGDKNIDKLFKDLDKMIKNNKLNMFKFFQLLKGYNSICTTKLIILGDFARTWFKHYSSEHKDNWKKIYNKTLCFELPITLLPIKEIKLGQNHLLMLTVEGEVYAMGDGTKGATGNKVKTFHCVPTKVAFPFPNTIIEHIAAGSRHSLAVDNSSTLYSWGCGACGCLGLDSKDDAYEPKQVKLSLAGDTIAEIDAGDNYSACVTNDGHLFTWGNPQFERLGLPKEITNTDVPQKVKDQFTGIVSHIKCGYLTMLVYTKKKQIFGFGFQNLSSLMSRENTNNKYKHPISGVLFEKESDKNYKFKISFPKDNPKDTNDKVEKLLGLFVGYKHFGAVVKLLNDNNNNNTHIPALSDNNELTSSSSTSTMKFCYYDIDLLQNVHLHHSQSELINLCEGDQTFDARITQGFLPLNYKESQREEKGRGKKQIKKIVCSQNNTAILANTGDVYVFGSYLYHVAPSENIYSIVQPHGTKVVHIALGADHILMVTSSKEVYAAGRNSEGQLGLGYTSKYIEISKAKIIEQFSNQGPRKCYAAENYSVVITTGAKSRLWVFGDAAFLQSSYKLLLPREQDWGEVEKVACGSSHMLLLVKGSDNLYKIMSVGKGIYGKLGDSDTTGKNHGKPVDVDLPYMEIKYTRDVKLRCGKYTSGALIKESTDQTNKNYNLYMWGLVNHKVISNIKDVESKHSFGDNFPIENTYPVIKPYLLTNYSVQDLAIGEGICYFILSDKNALEKIGDFGKSAKKKGIIADKFKKVSLGLNHAAAVSQTGKLFTWGSNVMNKLGFNKKDDKENTNITLSTIEEMKKIDVDNYFEGDPSNVVKFNAIFEEQNASQTDEQINDILKNIDEEDEDNEDNNNNNETPMKGSEIQTASINVDNDTNSNKLKKQKTKTDKDDTNNDDNDQNEEKEINQTDSIFAKAREVVKSSRLKYEDLEKKLQRKERILHDKLKTTLESYKFLIDNSDEAKKVYKALQNMFCFKFSGKPLNINITNTKNNWKNYSDDFKKYRKCFKALISILHTHPCYLLNIYRYHLMDDKDLYRIIKQIFKGMRNDRYTQFIFITLIKEILKIDIEQKKINELDDYDILDEKESKYDKYTLFGHLSKLLFKLDSEYIRRQDIGAMYIIGNIFSKSDNVQGENENMLLQIHPDNKSKTPKLEYNNYVRGQRVKNIIDQFCYFNDKLMDKPSLDNKNNLFSLSDSKDLKPLFKIPKICSILIKELRKELKAVTPDDAKITDWLSKKFAIIMFRRLVKVLADPGKRLALDVGLATERNIYRSFMENSKNNFYSVSYAFRYCFRILGMKDSSNSAGDDEIHKQIETTFKAYIPSALINIKNILLDSHETTDTTNTQQLLKGSLQSKEFDIEFVKEFFNHNLEDSNYIVNIEIELLQKVVNIIIANKNKIRVLNKQYDIMESVFDYYKLNKKVNLKYKAPFCQFNLKTKQLCTNNPLTLMKCSHCKCVLLNQFIIGNEVMIYDQFDFINKSSPKGKFIELLKQLGPIDSNTDKFNVFLRNQYEKNKEKTEFTDNIHQLFTLMAVDAKDDLYITEQMISEHDKLNQTMFNQNSTNITLKKYSEDIVACYDKMKDQVKYYEVLSDTFEQIKTNSINKVNDTINTNHFLIDIYNTISYAISVGYGNSEIEQFKNNLVFSSQFVKLISHNDNLPQSELLREELSEEMQREIKPTREFEMKKIMDSGVVKQLLIHQNNMLQHPSGYKLLISKEKNFEFNVSLLNREREKSSGLICGGTNRKRSSDWKKLCDSYVNSVTLAKIIRQANENTLMGNNKNKKTIYFTLSNIMEIEPIYFLSMLKKVCAIEIPKKPNRK